MKRRGNKLIIILALVSVACIVAAVVLMNLDKPPASAPTEPLPVITPPPAQDAPQSATGFYPVTALLDAGQQATLGEMIMRGITESASENSAYSATPTGEDLSWSDAFTTAVDALKGHGLTDAELAQCVAAFEFVSPDGTRMWHVQFAPADAQTQGTNSYVVSIFSPGGDVEGVYDSSDAVG